MRISLPRPLLFLLGGLFLVNLLQAFATELLYDEAYYWYYAQSPSWGYFDHPPMVAWLIALGTLITDNELGVRLLSCLLGIGTIVLIWALTEYRQKDQYPRQFFIWVLSMALLHAYGFLSLPDTPLLFFTALFLFLYRKFLDNPGFATATFLGICMAALMYSKYHAALVILLVLLSNLRLLRNPYAWLALGVSLVCYLPHLRWLYLNDFVSVEFHLFERPNQPYSFSKFTLGYLLNLVALFGLTFPLVYRELFRFRPQNLNQKALIYLTYGFLLFFFLSSFQRRVQTQWLVVICIPTAVIMAGQLMERPGLRKWIWRLGLINVILLIWLRIGLVFEPLFPVPFETHGNKAWVRDLEKVSEGQPVVFENSYQRASMYQFYSRRPAISLNNVNYRHNQYSIDSSEFRLQGRRVFYAFKNAGDGELYYQDGEGNRKYGKFMDDFRSFRKLRAGFQTDASLKPGGPIQMWAFNPYPHSIPLSGLRFGVAYLDGYKRLIEVREIPSDNPLTEVLMPGDTLKFRVVLPSPVEPGPDFARAVISEERLYWGINGSAQKLDP